MKILMLAPQPFYQERGSPISIDLMLKVLQHRGDLIDLVTYQEGEPRKYTNVRTYRIPKLPFVSGVRPGFSWKKVFCDFFLIIRAFQLASKGHYDLVHSVEEAVFIAMLLKWFFKIPYIYDMDSSMADQIVQKHKFLHLLEPFLSFMEARAAKSAICVIAMCESLSALAKRYGAKKAWVLSDVSLIQNAEPFLKDAAHKEFEIKGLVVLYVGNLEVYQGIDMLLEAFQEIRSSSYEVSLVVIGGREKDIQKYKEKTKLLDIADHVYFAGPRPLTSLRSYLSSADILVSPRLNGSNTPMKIYSYLHAGKAILATRLETHTQVLNDTNSLLCEPLPEAFAEGMRRLVHDKDLRHKLGHEAQKLAEEKYTLRAFESNLNRFYTELDSLIHPDKSEEFRKTSVHERVSL